MAAGYRLLPDLLLHARAQGTVVGLEYLADAGRPGQQRPGLRGVLPDRHKLPIQGEPRLPGVSLRLGEAAQAGRHPAQERGDPIGIALLRAGEGPLVGRIASEREAERQRDAGAVRLTHFVLRVRQVLVADGLLLGGVVLPEHRDVAERGGGGDQDSEHAERDEELASDRATPSHIAVLFSRIGLGEDVVLLPKVAHHMLRVIIR
jgi:hypothetical protein